MECADSVMEPQEPCGVCPRNPNFSQNCSWAGPWAEPSADGGTTLLLGHLAGLACDRSRSQISAAITKSLLYCRAPWAFPSPQRGAVQRPRIQEKENSSSKLGCSSRQKESNVVTLFTTLCGWHSTLKACPHIASIPATLAAWFTSAMEWRGLAASPLAQ